MSVSELLSFSVCNSSTNPQISLQNQRLSQVFVHSNSEWHEVAFSISTHFSALSSHVIQRPCILEVATLLTWSRSSSIPQASYSTSQRAEGTWAEVTRNMNQITPMPIEMWLRLMVTQDAAQSCWVLTSKVMRGLWAISNFPRMVSCWVSKLRLPTEPQIVPISGNSQWQLGFLFLLWGILLFFSSVGTNLPVVLANENLREAENIYELTLQQSPESSVGHRLLTLSQEHCPQPDFCRLPCPEDIQPLTSTLSPHKCLTRGTKNYLVVHSLCPRFFLSGNIPRRLDFNHLLRKRSLAWVTSRS
jgi:hypothetical protein